MKISYMRVRIIFQRNETVVDRFGNHKSAWTDYFSCWATVSKESQKNDEKAAAGVTTEENRSRFTVRWSGETAAVNTKEYRILLMDRIYNIVSIDEQGFRKKSRSFTAELAER